MSLLEKIARRGLREHLLAIEALCLLAFFRACLALVPVRKIIGAFTRGAQKEAHTSSAKLSDFERAAALRVQWAVRAAARHSPVEFVCFPQSLTAYWMLRRRGYSSTIVYGVDRSPGGHLLAHTWLEMGNAVVVGGEESDGFTVVERWH
jgi:hypothetical protein